VVERNLAKVEVARSNRVTRFEQSKTFKADGLPSAFLFCQKPVTTNRFILRTTDIKTLLIALHRFSWDN
jgi:hypothetical protein